MVSAQSGRSDYVVREATLDDIPRIVEIAQNLALERNKDKGRDWLSNHGFLVSAYGADKYEAFMGDPNTGTIVIESEGQVLGFLLYYNKDFIDPTDPSQELNYLAQTTIEGHYGERASLYIIKQVGIDYSVGHRGLGSTLYDALGSLAEENDIDFVFAAVVNDEPILDRARELGASFPLPNRASAAFHLANGYERVVGVFLYTHEQDADPESLPSGLHNRELYGRAVSPGQRALPFFSVPTGNQP